MKFKEIQKLSKAERDKKLKDLKIELMKSKTGVAKQSGSRSRQIKRIIARVKTLDSLELKSGGKRK